MNKQDIIQAVKESASSIEGLESLTLVGSHGYPDKELEQTNDFDFLFVFDDLNPQSLQSLKEELTQVAESLDQPDHAVWAEFRIGPIKPECPREADMCSMLHALLFDKQSFRSYVERSPFVSSDWSKFDPLWGRSLTDIFDFDWPTKDDLLHAKRASTQYYREMLDDRKYMYVDLIEEGGELKPKRSEVEMQEVLLPEIISNVLHKVMLNAVMVYEEESKRWDKEELLEIFLEHFSGFRQQQDELKKLLATKKKARAGKELAYNTQELEEKVRSFLDKLEKQLRSDL